MAEKFEQMLRVLNEDKEYEKEYEQFVKGVSYAAEGDVPTFGNAVKAVSSLVQAVTKSEYGFKNEGAMTSHRHIKWRNPDIILSYTQTIGIVATLLLTIVLAYCNEQSQSDRNSGDFTLKFDDRMHSGSGAVIAKTLDRDGKLDDLHLSKRHQER